MAADRPKTTRSRNWLKDDMERLVCWMEENQQSLRGKQATWHKDVKEQIFAENEEITVKRIGEKVQNMKNSWRNARKIQEQSGELYRQFNDPPDIFQHSFTLRDSRHGDIRCVTKQP